MRSTEANSRPRGLPWLVALGFAGLLAGPIAACSGTAAPGSAVTSANPDDSGVSLDASSSDAMEGDGGGGSTSSTSATNGSLAIVNLTATSKTIVGGNPLPTESGSTTFVAIVTDTKGVDAIAGGQLADDQGNLYGAFGAGANKGTYTSTVSWAALTAIAAPSFAAAPGSRNFVVRFFDNDGKSVEAPLSVGLACRDGNSNLVGACAGTCVDTQVDGANCGQCGKRCMPSLACGASTCAPLAYTPGIGTECARVDEAVPGATCNDLCGAEGGRIGLGLRFFSENTCVGDVGTGNADVPIRTNEPLSPIRYFRCRCALH
jgi:hypothetical protein